jgi:hypothetical protein|eukprot:2547938-Prymnesium_polylepis.1
MPGVATSGVGKAKTQEASEVQDAIRLLAAARVIADLRGRVRRAQLVARVDVDILARKGKA